MCTGSIPELFSYTLCTAMTHKLLATLASQYDMETETFLQKKRDCLYSGDRYKTQVIQRQNSSVSQELRKEFSAIVSLWTSISLGLLTGRA